MARPELVFDIAVVFRALVLIFDQQPYRRTGCLAFEHTGKNFHLIRLIALCCVTIAPRPTPIKVALNIRFR